jgi:hypothetical protein
MTAAMNAARNMIAATGPVSPRPFCVTIFPDEYAGTKSARDMTLWELQDKILTASAAKKDDLRLLKLARYGDTPSPKGCLRYDENVAAISGVVVEHDAETMSFDEAIGRLRDARVTALVYTSPSHTPANPRWRVVVPTSDSWSPALHEKLVARVNGVLGGVLAPIESFTLSLAYYFGSINANPHHRCEYTIGEFINLRGDLDAGAIYKESKSGIRNPPLTDVAGVEPDVPIISLDDDRLRLSDVVRLMIENAAPPEKLRHLKGGRGHCFVVGQLVDGGLSNAQIKEVYRLGRIANGPRGCSRGFDGYVERVIAHCRSSAIEDYDFLHVDVDPIIAGWETQPAEQPQDEAVVPSVDQKEVPPEGTPIEAAPGIKPVGAPHLIQPSGEFVSGFVPPDYLIDGWLQRRFVYSMTGMTGHGKTTVMLYIAACAALGIKIDDREVEKCRVLFFAGENPDDIRMRWIKLCEEMGRDPADIDVFFLPGTPPISDKEIRKRIHAETTKHGPFGLLIIDTSAAYFQGDDENSNTQLGNHARMLRSFVGLPGGPTVVVTCHPTKNPSMDNLLPRGGGAFLAEVDGNLVCIKGDGSVSIHWHGKLRGPDFAPILFKLKPGTTEKLKDKKGRLIWTITASPITEAEKANIEDVSRSRQNELLTLLEKEPRLSLSEMAVKLDWQYKNGLPNTSLAYRMIAALVQDKLVVKKRGKITLTKTGAEEAAAAKKVKEDVPF